MRTEDEMFNLILELAKEDERIRLVGMEGSRTNKRAPKDRFQDYDISYIVTEMAPFIQNEKWLDLFGPRIFMQKPEAMSLYPQELGNWFSYLMLFEDGNRIDLTLIPLSELNVYLEKSDGLLEILLDKDNRVKDLPRSSDAFYHIQKPTEQFYDDCCNEFWWIATYVVKGICREEFLYAADYLNQYLRPELLRMVSWKVGLETDFSVSLGKNYKYLEDFVQPHLWNQLRETFEMHTYSHLWEALFTCLQLFREVSKEVADQLAFSYPDYDQSITNYVNQLYDEFR